MSNGEIILVTSCSHSRAVLPKVRVEDMPTGQTMKSALEWWLNQLDTFPPELTPREQYRGLGFSTLVKIQQAFSEVRSVKIITGGLGLTDLDEPITPYDFTADKNEPANVYQKVTGEPFVQSVWWKMINAARAKGAAPIAELVASNPQAKILVAASKVFLRYVADDILAIPLGDRHRVRILLAASSVGSVPSQLRPMIIPFDRGVIGHLPGNRNDGNHRATFFFLEKQKELDLNLFGIPTSEAAKYFRDGLESLGSKITQEAILKVLTDNPAYLKMDVGSAYKLIRKDHGALGGRMQFAALFRQAGGQANLLEVEVSEEEERKATEALSGLSFLSGSPSAATNTQDDSVKGARLFINMVSKVKPDAIFTAADLAQWAKAYYPEASTPSFLISPAKAIHILKNNVDILGIREITIDSGKAFKIDVGIVASINQAAE